MPTEMTIFDKLMLIAIFIVHPIAAIILWFWARNRYARRREQQS